MFFIIGIGGGIGGGSLGLSADNPGSGRVRAAVESVVVRHLMSDHYAGRLRETGMWQTFCAVEMPALTIMAAMELNGMGKISHILARSHPYMYTQDLTQIHRISPQTNTESHKFTGFRTN